MKTVGRLVVLGMCVVAWGGCQGGVWAGSWHKNAGFFVAPRTESAQRARVEEDLSSGKIDQYERDIRMDQITRDFS